MDGRWLHTAGIAALAALVLVWLASALPPDAFFSGDSGVKLIAALDAIEHPARPFDTDLPRIGSRALASATSSIGSTRSGCFVRSALASSAA